jgi:hypothetical protein
MLTAPPPPPPDNQALLFSFTNWITLPVEDWVWLLELAQRQGQALDAYLAHVLHDHVAQNQRQEPNA